MKSIILSTLCICLSTLSFSQDSTTAKPVLKEGTLVNCMLSETIDSKTTKTGDKVNFELAEPIMSGDRVLMAKGTRIVGTVTNAEASKMLGKGGKLAFSIDYLYLPDGNTVKLNTTVNAEGKNKAGGAVAAAVIVNPVFLVMKGKQAKYEKGQLFTTYIDHDTSL